MEIIGQWILVMSLKISLHKSATSQVVTLPMVSEQACERNIKTLKRKLSGRTIYSFCVYTGQYEVPPHMLN